MKQPTLKTSCVLCRTRIPENRQRRNAITCSTAHQKLYRKLRKAERDRRICDKCGRPCTPQEKLEFRRWREEQAQKSGDPAKRVRDAAKALKTMAFVCPDPSQKPKSRKRNFKTARRKRAA